MILLLPKLLQKTQSILLELGHAFVALCALAKEKVTILGNISVGKVGGSTNFAM